MGTRSDYGRLNGRDLDKRQETQRRDDSSSRSPKTEKVKSDTRESLSRNFKSR